MHLIAVVLINLSQSTFMLHSIIHLYHVLYKKMCFGGKIELRNLEVYSKQVKNQISQKVGAIYVYEKLAYFTHIEEAVLC